MTFQQVATVFLTLDVPNFQNACVSNNAHREHDTYILKRNVFTLVNFNIWIFIDKDQVVCLVYLGNPLSPHVTLSY